MLLRLPTAVSVTHACLAQTFLCLVVTLAVWTTPGWQERAAPTRRLWSRRLLVVAHPDPAGRRKWRISYSFFWGR